MANFSADEPQKDIYLMYGLAKKPFAEMSPEERSEASLKALERAKEAAFTRGLPIIYGENGFVIAEYMDGKRFIRENGEDIKPYYG